MIRIGVIGFGYWGPNIVRNFSRQKDAVVSWICDIDPQALTRIAYQYPEVKTTMDYRDILSDAAVDAVVIVTPIVTHFSLASEAIRAGKHVLVEKPMTQTASQAQKLVALARKKKKILMVDHTFIYTPAVRYIKQLISRGGLGDIYAIDSVRTNLGLIQTTSNVIYDLAVHDFSIIDNLFGLLPVTLSVTGILQKDIRQETVAHIAATYSGGLFFHAHVSWLSPVKIRRMIFTGTKKMLVYDDIEPSEKIKIYDKGVSFTKDPEESLRLRIGYRNGDIIIPEIPMEEGLFGMAGEFVRSVRTGTPPLSDGRSGAAVIRCLELATKSLRTGGKLFRL
jgi:predicted dehydrogenase